MTEGAFNSRPVKNASFLLCLQCIKKFGDIKIRIYVASTTSVTSTGILKTKTYSFNSQRKVLQDYGFL
jgi:ABC-type tungstate transport system permease subunit